MVIRLRNICNLTIILVISLLFLSACVYTPVQFDEDEQTVIPSAEEVSEESSNDILPSLESNSEYVLLAEIYNWERTEFDHAFLSPSIPSLEVGKKYFDDFLTKYDKDTKSHIQSISTDGKYIVFEELIDNYDYMTEVFEDQNLTFYSNYDIYNYRLNDYWLSKIDYNLSPDDYAEELTFSLLINGVPYTAANVMIDVYSSTGKMPVKVSDDCSAYLLSEWQGELDLIYSIYTYPNHELVVSFKLPYNEVAESSGDIMIKQFLDIHHIIYALGNEKNTYLFDLNDNSDIELGYDMWFPFLSPDGKYFAYESRSLNSLLQRGYYIIDLENDKTYYYGVEKEDDPRIIGWCPESVLTSKP